MNDILAVFSLIFAAAAAIGVGILLMRRPARPDLAPLLRSLDSLANTHAATAQNAREELARLLASLRTELGAQLDRATQAQHQLHDAARAATADTLAKTRAELAAAAADSRAESRAQFADFQKNTAASLADARSSQNQQLAQLQALLAEQLARSRDALATTLATAFATARAEQNAAAAEVRKTLDSRLETLASQNAAKLEEMRLTVDEKLQSTLEKRLGENFKQVSDRLENVHKSLGEMQAIATDVGDLKRVLTNVKTRGTWGEIQLGALLESLLQPDQYEANVKPNPRSENIVEFAVKLPGAQEGGNVWLPIDAKFPKEDYERIADAARRADAASLEQATRALSAFVEKSARDIRDKYISPPHTTDFAILFLPTEGLYAEVLRGGAVEKIQREYRVLLAGPTILGALLNSLQMGFRTLAIQKRSGEVWKILGAVKTQFGLFGDLLGKVGKKLEEAGNAVGQATDRHRIITNRFAKVQELPVDEAAALLPELAEKTPAFTLDNGA